MALTRYETEGQGWGVRKLLADLPIWETKGFVSERLQAIRFKPDLSYCNLCAPNVTTTYVTDADAGAVWFTGVGETRSYMVQIDGDSDDGQVLASTGGRFVLTTNDADNDALYLGFWGPTATATGTLPFLPVASSAIRFGMRAKLTDVDKMDVMFGLSVVNTAPFGGVTDGIYFEMLSGAAVFSGVLEKNNSETTDDLTTTIEDGAYFDVGFEVQGLTSVTYYHDAESSEASAVTNLDDDQPLCPFIAIRNFGAQANTMTIERLECIQTIV